MPPSRLPGALLRAELSALGPYFAVGAHGAGTAVRQPWQPLGALAGSPGALRERAVQTRRALARNAGPAAPAPSFRVAASVAHLGLAARLISPVFGAAVLSRGVLPMEMDQARWAPAAGSMIQLSLPDTAIDAAASPGQLGTAALADALARGLLDGPVGALVDSYADMSVSRQILWGNVASAINGATVVVSQGRPGLRDRATELADALLSTPHLTGRHHGRPGRDFRRRSCCLIYRAAPAPGAGICGDCVLAARRPD